MELGAQDTAGTISRSDAEHPAHKEYREAGSPPLIFVEPPPTVGSENDPSAAAGADASASDAFESGCVVHDVFCAASSSQLISWRIGYARAGPWRGGS